MREEERRMKEEEEKRRKEEKERLKKEKLEEEKRKKEEAEQKRVQEEIDRLAREAEEKRIEKEKLKAEEEKKLRSQLTAKSMYEQALNSMRNAQKSLSSDKVVTLRKGTISDIRNKIFEKKAAEQKPISKKIVPKKHIITDNDKTVKENELVNDEEVAMKEITKLEKNKADATNVEEQNKPEVIAVDESTQKDDGKNNKRQSFINDFAALEKTYRMLGIHKESVKLDEEIKPEKKRHASEGKAKKKSKSKSTSDMKKNEEDLAVKVEVNKIKIDALDKGQSEAKRNFFQDLINEKKGLVSKDVVLNGPKLRKKTDLVSAFEQKTRESTKRNSLIKEDVKVSFFFILTI